MPSAVTMDDIARRVGVHRATVSNVLNHRLKSERPDAARRAAEIRRVAFQMGYRPSTAARATRTGRSGFIGMIRSPRLMCSVHSPSFDSGLDETLNSRGLCLLRDMIHDEADDAPRIVRENVVDGLIINYAFGTPAPIRELLERCDLPTVWINRKRDSNCVRPNDEGAAYEATSQLLALGHRRICFLNDFATHVKPGVEEHYSYADRCAGYERAMAEAGLSPNVEALSDSSLPDDPLLRTDWRYRSVTSWLKKEHLPTAVLCCDGAGRTLRMTALALGINVPRDLSIMTFDNDAAADTDIAVDRLLLRYQAMGHATVEMLCALIDQRSLSSEPIVVPFEFHRVGTVTRLRR